LINKKTINAGNNLKEIFYNCPEINEHNVKRRKDVKTNRRVILLMLKLSSLIIKKTGARSPQKNKISKIGPS